MNILIEDFLSVEEVAIYLENYGYKYDLEKQSEYTRLLSKIYDLTNQRNITATFYYHGMLKKEINYFETDEDNNGRPIKIPLHEEWSSKYVENYFYINRKLLQDIFIYEKKVKINNHIEEYGTNVSTFQNQDEFYHLSDDVQISLRDVRIPRHELDNLFQKAVFTNTTGNQINKTDQKLLDDNIPNDVSGMGTPAVRHSKPKTNEQLSQELNTARVSIDQQQQKIDALQDQLRKHAEKTADNKELNPKDSAYCLIAVLKNLLLDPDINAYHFKTDDTKSTNQPTQAGLAEYITSLSIKDLKARNINGIFSKANSLLNDAKKS